MEALFFPLPSTAGGPYTTGYLELPTVSRGGVFIYTAVTYRSALDSWLVHFERRKVSWMKPETGKTRPRRQGKVPIKPRCLRGVHLFSSYMS